MKAMLGRPPRARCGKDAAARVGHAVGMDADIALRTRPAACVALSVSDDTPVRRVTAPRGADAS